MDHANRDRAVVIGAGMGGLAAAIRLAAAGMDVTILDRHPWPGGKMRSIDSPAGPVDAGPTVLTLRPVFEDLFAAAGTTLDAHVTLHRESLLARHLWPDGSTLDLHDDAETSAQAVRAFAGARGEADFRAFSATARALFQAFDRPVMQAAAPRLPGLVAHVLKHPALLPAMAPHLTLARSLARRFADPRLRQLFGRYATYVGGSPYAAPAVLGLIWHSEAQGVWRVEGGMHRLAQALRQVAEGLGVSVHLATEADRIETQFGRVAGVVTADGRRFPAAHVVFNGDPRALSTGLLGPATRAAVAPEGVAPRSQSAYVWSFAARLTVADGTPQPAHHTVCFGARPQSEFDDLAAGRMPADPTLYLCAQDRGTGTAPPALERFEIIMNGPPLTAGRPEDPETCRTLVFPTLARFGLTFDPTPQGPALTTPAGFDRLFPGSAGSLYGRSPHGLMAAFQRPVARSRLPGLYLAGGGAHPGAGIPMATLSGRHAAAAILQDRASTSTYRPTATPGGMSTGSATTAAARSRSSASSAPSSRPGTPGADGAPPPTTAA
jgi:1-hydroxycarotenoid 3,4-desaturase